MHSPQKIGTALFLLILINLCLSNTLIAQDSTLVRAGLLSSVYGFSSFPDSTWWARATTDMSNKFSGTEPAVIWILGYTTQGGCYLNFPKPSGSTYSKIYFGNSDGNERYLEEFDNNGTKVWLQIEPGGADISTVIDLVLTRYGHHPCIIGFGVDVEWYKTSADNDYEGVAVTDAEAQEWAEKVRSYNSDYLLFTKHWLISKMPPTYREGMVFVDDSQIFPNMSSMMNEFEDWGKAFSTANVAFQYGYDSDKIWWQNLSDPPKDIGDEILKRCPNTSGLFWVDFTAHDIWPRNFADVNDEVAAGPDLFLLHQNYPNPFNPVTTIVYSLGKRSDVTLKVFDVQGRTVNEFTRMNETAGSHMIHIDLTDQNSGVYFYQLISGDKIETKKMTLIK